MELFAVSNLPEVNEGDDLAALITEQVDLRSDDIICVASTIISKAEGRTANLDRFSPGPRARELTTALDSDIDPRFTQAVLEESVEVIL